MPLKEEIIPHLEQTDPLSAKIGAVTPFVYWMANSTASIPTLRAS